MNTLKIGRVQKKIDPVRKKIIEHPLFKTIKSPTDVQIFMEHHVYAVWDFMSLLKSLQIHLTCTKLPWRPIGNGQTRYLINEIVLGEESDIDFYGQRKSHFEMYIDAMTQAGSNTSNILNFIEFYNKYESIDFALNAARAPLKAADFVKDTFSIIQTEKPHIIAGAFTFGREDLIPDMFLSVVDSINENFENQFALLKYYLDRHIEVDGGHHGKLALEMVSELCGNDENLWLEVEKISYKTLKLRLELWDAILKAIKIKPISKTSRVLNKFLWVNN